VSENGTTTIRIPILFWARLIFDLRRRGKGRSESGAFLLGARNGDAGRVTRYICYDDLDPRAHQFGAITFHATGQAALWSFCRDHNVEILADVHTHPGPHVQQSGIDQKNPMVPMAGHTAIIVPNFAYTPCWSLRAVGVHEYLGGFRWRQHSPSARPRRVSLALW
jgi:proteasome lid subunit RPN8/RPN11